MVIFKFLLKLKNLSHSRKKNRIIKIFAQKLLVVFPYFSLLLVPDTFHGTVNNTGLKLNEYKLRYSYIMYTITYFN